MKKCKDKNDNSKRKPTALVLCGGAGGSTEGLKEAGFEIVAVNDNWDLACDIHELNHPGIKVIRGDISDDKTKKKILVQFKGCPPDLVVITAPCQDDSLANRSRDPGSERANTLWHCMEIAADLGTPVVVSEHVCGFMSAKGSDGIPRPHRLAERASRVGLKTDFVALSSADFGVAQLRTRIFAFSTRFDVDFEPPEPTHGEGRKKPWVTAEDAIGDLVDREEDAEFSHVFACHGEAVREDIENSEPGGRVGGEKRWRIRLHPDRPSPTIRAGSGDIPIHYALDRAITPREAARFQAISDSFRFTASKTETNRLVGNAVPPPLMGAVGRSVIKMLNQIGPDTPTVGPEELDLRLASMNAHPSLREEDLTEELETLRKSTVKAFVSKNARREKAKAKAEGLGLEMGADIECFFQSVNVDGRRYSDNSIYGLLEDHRDYTLRKGMIREYHIWWKDWQAVAEETGEEPPKLNVSMWEVVRDYKTQSLDPFEKLEVLRVAEATGLSVRGLREVIGKQKDGNGKAPRKTKPERDFAAEMLKFLKDTARNAGKLIKDAHVQEAVVPQARMDSVNEILRVAQKGSQEVVRTPRKRQKVVPAAPAVAKVVETMKAAA
jgi:DNA (cytosine-5)-methyltransferase 1